MKLRSMIGFCALAAAAFGLDSNMCGLMNVPSSTATTMIAVPWVTVNGSADTMKVANLVKTDTLTAGDELYYYDGSTYYHWVLANGAWSPTATVKGTDGASVTTTAPDADYAIARGKGLFLVRQSTDSEIWLYGQNSTATTSVTPTAGTSSAAVYTMIANPGTSDYDLNAKGVEGASGDTIMLGDSATIYNYNGSDWTKTTTTKKTIGGVERTMQTQTTEGGVTIPAGQGAWYVSKGGSPTIAW